MQNNKPKNNSQLKNNEDLNLNKGRNGEEDKSSLDVKENKGIKYEENIYKGDDSIEEEKYAELKYNDECIQNEEPINHTGINAGKINLVNNQQFDGNSLILQGFVESTNRGLNYYNYNEPSKISKIRDFNNNTEKRESNGPNLIMKLLLEKCANRGLISTNLKETSTSLMNEDSNMDNTKDFQYPPQNSEKNISHKQTSLIKENKFYKLNNDQRILNTNTIKNGGQTTHIIEIKIKNENVIIIEPMNNINVINNSENNVIDSENEISYKEGNQNENEEKEKIRDSNESKSEKELEKVFNPPNPLIENKMASIESNRSGGYDNFYND